MPDGIEDFMLADPTPGEERARLIIERAMALRAYLDSVVAPTISDREATDSVPTLVFPIWNAGEDYAAGDRVRYDDALYRVVQAHTSQLDWTPDKVPALYARLRSSQDEEADREGIDAWEQPTAENPYMRGDIVRHIGAFWESLVDNNVWEPSAQTEALSLWKQITLPNI